MTDTKPATDYDAMAAELLPAGATPHLTQRDLAAALRKAHADGIAKERERVRAILSKESDRWSEKFLDQRNDHDDARRYAGIASVLSQVSGQIADAPPQEEER